MLKINYETGQKIDNDVDSLHPITGVLGIILLLAICLVFFIPIVIFLFICTIDEIFYKIFTKRNLVILILSVNSFCIIYLLLILQTK